MTVGSGARVKTAVLAVFGVLLAVGAAAGCSGSSSGVSADFDADDDGLVEIFNLEQLDAVRWDLNGDGRSDEALASAAADAYGSAFPDAMAGMGCPDGGCVGYELAGDLDFDDAGSYASGEVNADWTQGPGWMSMGDHDHPFSAVLDGGGYEIANLFAAVEGGDDVGLFGEITGTVRNLSLTGAAVSGYGSVGILVGTNRGTVDGVNVSGVVSGYRDVGGLNGYNVGTINRSRADAEVTGVLVVGVLVGANENTITASSSSGSVVARSRVIGGLTGVNRGTISDSHASSDATGSDMVGGLAGVNRGTVSTSSATGSVTGHVATGGLIGWNERDLTGSYATGSVAGDENDLGGLVGRNSGAIAASYATGDVQGYHRVGGLVGYNSGTGTVAAGYATGAVRGDFEAGGLMGWNRGEVRSSYATGSVSSERDAAGLVGENNGAISSSYWDVETSGLDVGVAYGPTEGVEAKTTAELQSPAGYRGIYETWAAAGDFWDFGSSSDYPRLKADMDGDGVATAEEMAPRG